MVVLLRPRPGSGGTGSNPANDGPGRTDRREDELVIESWRNDDLTIWQDQIIPAFNKQHPDIEVVFQPAAPDVTTRVLNTKLEGGTAGDLITCRPFDASLALFQKGYLAPLTDLAGMANFSDVAKSAWITDDGKTPFCVPMASVIHGFIYNKEAFDKLGLKPPTTKEEFKAGAGQDQSRRHVCAAGDGHCRSVGGRDDGLPEYRPQQLEGRRRPVGVDQGHAEIHGCSRTFRL